MVQSLTQPLVMRFGFHSVQGIPLLMPGGALLLPIHEMPRKQGFHFFLLGGIQCQIQGHSPGLQAGLLFRTEFTVHPMVSFFVMGTVLCRSSESNQEHAQGYNFFHVILFGFTC